MLNIFDIYFLVCKFRQRMEIAVENEKGSVKRS